jgi:hypothetical protein
MEGTYFVLLLSHAKGTTVRLLELVLRFFATPPILRYMAVGAGGVVFVSTNQNVLLMVQLEHPFHPVQDLDVVILQPLFVDVYPEGVDGVQPVQAPGTQQLPQ